MRSFYELQQAKAQQGVTEEQMRVKIIEREKQIELEEKRLRVVKSNTMQK